MHTTTPVQPAPTRSVAIAAALPLVRLGVESAVNAHPAFRVVNAVGTVAELLAHGVPADLVVAEVQGREPVAGLAELAGRSGVVLLAGRDDPRLAGLSGVASVLPGTTSPAELVRELCVVSGGLPAQPNVLTRREVETVRLISSGLTNRQIARRLGLSEATVDTYVKRIRNKLRVSNKAELVSRVLSAGYLVA
ncbi:DNA-binding NarL/FixJ family response regulator [Crossiella equi]|uniref:DNA-binding NarL/FixJ family response regulator n=1 Tax=Crossiella equi TaxID=130796 RepID=A0ABS5A5H3_9PSEU|nr:response regulator transcription factor [Crossiella equi]MBP2471853.1 DNA-binding NarL/FixJ family response regulator [Crossiella equi]